MTTSECLRSLADRLSLNSVELAQLLQSEGDTYPSSGLIRNMLLGGQEPSKRFTLLLETRLAEIEQQTEAGLLALWLNGRMRRIYAVNQQRVFSTILSLDANDNVTLKDESVIKDTLEAFYAVRPEQVKRCHVCDGLFIASNQMQEVCRRVGPTGHFDCVTERDRRLKVSKRTRRA